MQKFDELINREVSQIIQRMFPDRIFSITQVHVSKDLAFAKIWVSSLADVDSLIKELRGESHSIKHELSKKIIARKIPNLYFVADKTTEEAMKIDRLIEETKKDK